MSLNQHEVSELVAQLAAARKWEFQSTIGVYARTELGRAALHQYIQAQPVVYDGSQGPTDPFGRYTFRVPFNSEGALRVDRTGATAVVRGAMMPYQLRGMGLGGRMYRAGFSLLGDIGVERVTSDNVSSSALRVRASVCGTDALEFYEKDHPHAILPISFDDALAMTVRAELQDPRGISLPPLGVLTDLTALDMSSWTRPELRAAD